MSNGLGGRKLDRQRFFKVLDKHGWRALELYGQRVAAEVPFFTITYK